MTIDRRDRQMNGTEKREAAARKLHAATACASCTSETERRQLLDLMGILRSEISDKDYDRVSDLLDREIKRLARRHTCSEFYGVSLGDAESPYRLVGHLNETDGKVGFAINYTSRDNRLYGPVASSPDAARKAFKEMVGRI